MNEMSVEEWWNEICGSGKWEKPQEKPIQTPLCSTRNTLGVTEMQAQDPRSGRLASNHLHN